MFGSTSYKTGSDKTVLAIGRMSDYEIQPKPKVWAGSPNEC